MANMDVASWLSQDVASWLLGEGFAELVEKFKDEDVDGAALLSLTSEDLKELGFKLGARKRLLKCIDDLRSNQQSGAQESGAHESLPENCASHGIASISRQMKMEAPITPQRGLVIAVVTLSETESNFVILDEGRNRVVRPTPLAEYGSAWQMSEFPECSCEVGSLIEYTPTTEGMNALSNPKSIDIPCSCLRPLNSPTCGTVFERVLPAACESINSAWPKVDMNDACVPVDQSVRSVAVVKGSVARLFRSPPRADVQLGGQILRALPVSCNALGLDENTGAGDEVNGMENKPGLVVLSLKRDDSDDGSDKSEKLLAQILLCGFIAAPDEKRTACEDQIVLANIFSLREFPWSHNGASVNDDLNLYVDVLLRFLKESMDSEAASPWLQRKDDRRRLELLFEVLSGESSQMSVKMFPQYHCFAAFKLSIEGCYPSERAASYLVEPTSGEAWKNGRAGTRVLAGGTMSRENVARLQAPPPFSNDTTPSPILHIFRKLLDVAAHDGSRHHIEEDCFATLEATSLRNRVRHRSAHWSLVSAAVRFVLSNLDDRLNPDEFYKQLVMQFCLWLAERQTGMISPANATASRINTSIGMLTKVATKASKMAERGFCVNGLEERIKKLRMRLDEAVRGMAKCCAARYLLPELHNLLTEDPSVEIQVLQQPTRQLCEVQSDALKRSERNVGALPIPCAGYARLNDVNAWFDWLATVDARTRDASELLVLRLCERVFFECASQGFESGDTEVLEKVVDEYRKLSDRFKNGRAVRIVEQRSREVLVVSIAFCIKHASTCEQYSFLRRYKIGLTLDSFKHLVLPERAAVDAATHVHRYVFSNNANAHEGAVFTLRSERPTFQLAEDVSRSTNKILRIWEDEVKDAAARVAAHWAEVQRKQELAKRLRVMIKDLEDRRDDLQAQLDEVLSLERQRDQAKRHRQDVQDSISRAQNRIADLRKELTSASGLIHSERDLENEQERIRKLQTQLTTCSQEISDIQSQLASRTPRFTLENDLRKVNADIERKRAELAAAEIPPPAVFQPLPNDESKALAVLFFLFMPPAFRSLSRMSFLAQQVSLPFPWEVKGSWNVIAVAKVEQYSTSWVNYYNQMQMHNKDYHRPSTRRDGCDGAVSLHSSGQPPREDVVRGKHVDHMQSEMDGVWFPDPLSPSMAWRTSGLQVGKGDWFNPFCPLQAEWRRKYFTESLPAFAKPLQWTMYLPDDMSEIHASRANKAIAMKNNSQERPDWLSKPAFEAFVRLRAYPNTKFRKLCVALQQEVLPLTNSAVQALIRQSTFELGPISDDSKLLWRSDIDGLDGLLAIGRILSKLADQYSQKSRSHEAMTILGELASYFAQWNDEFASVPRDLAKACLDWARDASQQVLIADQASRGELRGKQCLFSAYALLCHFGMRLEPSDAQNMCEAMVRIHAGLETGADEDFPQFQVLRILCEDVMARQIALIVNYARQDSTICTTAIRAALEHVPTDLVWQQRSIETGRFGASHTSWFEATSQEGHLFSLNIFKGVALLDGYPPAQLPGSITSHALYRRTFGAETFVITSTGSGRFRTTHAVDARFYEFAEVSDGGLLIVEIQDGSPVLELQDLSLRENSLPVRLREMHSHWYCPEYGLLLCRPVNFRERSCRYVVSVSDGVCLQVPDHYSQLGVRDLWTQKDQLTHRLVPHHSAATEVLSKFEYAELIHAYCCSMDRKPQPAISMIELPRYRLSFKAEKGHVWSCDYRGYRLAQQQQLSETLLNFDHYLVLERGECADPSLPFRRMLMPDASVRKDLHGNVVLKVSKDDYGADCQCVQFKIHPRFGYLMAENVSGRLQLAALHVATGMRLPEQMGSGLTGVEAAMMLVRQCRSSRPLSRVEQDKLQDLILLCEDAPALKLLCHDIHLSSMQLGFLYDGEMSRPLARYGIRDDVVKAYLREAQASLRNFRRLLTVQEEQRILGIRSDRGCFSQMPVLVTLPDCPVPAEYIANFEDRLKALTISPAPKVNVALPAFPLDVKVKSKSEVTAMEDLKASWVAYHKKQLQQSELKPDACSRKTFEELHCEVVTNKKKVHEYLQNALNRFPEEDARGFGIAERIRRDGCLAPRASILDFALMALQPDNVKLFTPFLKHEAEAYFIDCVFLFLRLCVLEDKMSRLCGISRNEQPQPQLLLQELLSHRAWDVREHPEWLVFEVEGGLQIRPIQYKVAKFLMNDPGKLVQLNMGEGKTRVIVPMLILHWANGEHVVRLHVLSSLLHEMYDFLHANLCASLLGRRIFMLPFHRDIKPSAERLHMMCRVLEECKQDKGVLLVAPEHRLSLLLKQRECQQQSKGALCSAFDRLTSYPMRDLFDESDEILRHKYQLIYAVGGAVDLPQGTERWIASQAILRVMKEEDVIEIFRTPGFAQHERRNQDAFDVIRLTNDGMEETIGDLYDAIVNALFSRPPYELCWLSQYEYEPRIRDFLINPSRSKDDLPREISEDRITVLLALRGLLACGVLRHCLEKRHCVDYGVNPQGKKRLAVPFRASNTPSERSEFGHPDSAILLTILSYYYRGLSRDEVKNACLKLLQTGYTEQKQLYNCWYALSSGRIESDDERLMIDSVEKLDLSNEQQSDVLYKYYQYNKETINFWLNHCVFPMETKQYPLKLVGNAWNLVENPDKLIHGFSGTNDNQRLLPLQVAQEQISDLAGTNGEMLDLLLRSDSDEGDSAYHTLPDTGTDWKAVIRQVIDLGVDALIDCGALTVGASGKELAEILMQERGEVFQGVLFFDLGTKQWMILDGCGRCLPKDTSPVEAKSCFAYFDEARSRGVDLKLKQTAKALVTIGPKLNKDKLMQAAGRMRMLGRGQTLCFLGTEEVTRKMRSLCNKPPSVLSLLQWTMHNTTTAEDEGLVEWARQGGVYLLSGHSKGPALPEILELKDFYAKSLTSKKASDIIDNDLNKLLKHTLWPKPHSSAARQLLERIRQHGRNFGSDFSQDASVQDEEYERELEREIQKEQELVNEVRQESPEHESDWRYDLVFDVDRACRLPIQVVPLEALTKRVPLLADLGVCWPQQILCTMNFVSTIRAPKDLGGFLRSVDAMLVFPNNDCLLLSDREADALLALFWLRRQASILVDSVRFLSFPLYRAYLDGDIPAPLMLPNECSLSDDIVAVLQMFMGETAYPTKARQRALTDFLQLDRRGQIAQTGRHAAMQLVKERGTLSAYERSDLAKLIAEIE